MTKAQMKKQYFEIDKELSVFRAHYNRQARADLNYYLRHHKSAQPQAPIPDRIQQKIYRWKRLKELLGF